MSAVDRILAALVSRAMRRGLRGEPLWLAVGVGAWLVHRGRRRADEPVWSGKLDSGERLTISVAEPARRGTTGSAEG